MLAQKGTATIKKGNKEASGKKQKQERPKTFITISKGL